ncbi:MAG: diaminopimelate epimerase [Eubacterium sp.]|nr:diaminopimelate epimerase [Eubacterium sp.]MBR0412855.1 diaminopimelate epimerase [Eubacterium sp.]
MKFTKMHGCGNDYVYFDCTEKSIADESAAAIKLSDRHFGIGGDGIIIIKKGTNADFEMVMYNADGTRGAMCGNGIRCVAKYVYDHQLTDKTSISIESMGAVKYIDVTVENGEVVSAKVDMGAPSLNAKDIPVICDSDRAVDYPITVDGTEYRMTCVSMGNPHAVVFIDKSPEEFDVECVGRLFENNAVFPDRTNTEFIFVKDRKNLEMRVWERGSGETLACGTGACASAVAAIVNGYCDNDVTVHLLGGDLEISWSGDENESVFMTGPATTVFEGEINLD